VSKRVRYGILGTGSIAAEVADALSLTTRCRAHRVASREPARATTFAEEHGVERALASYEELLADPEVDIVYVATPHTEHARWSAAALMNDKHVLCEKPLTVSESEAVPLVELARSRGRLLLEAFAYRFHPQTRVLLELVSGGKIGLVRAIDITFSYQVAAGYEGRATANALAGGGILDVGCYCTSAAQQIVAAAIGAMSAEPQEVTGLAALDPVEGTDLYAAAVMRFPGNILAQLACGVAVAQNDHIRVYGTEGHIHVDQPCWLPGLREAPSTIELTRSDGDGPRVVDIEGGRNIFAIEADAAAALLGQDVRSWLPYWADSLANLRTLDRWRSAVGVHYHLEDT
jgi:predicted dehydrogenase